MNLDRFKKLSFLSYLSIVLTIFSTTLLIEYFTITSQTKLMIEEAQKRASENVFGFAKIIINPTLEKDYSDIIEKGRIMQCLSQLLVVHGVYRDWETDRKSVV